MKLDARYLAGFIDADGCVAIARFNKPGSIHVRYQIRVTVTNCDRRVPDAIAKEFGGSVYQQSFKGKSRLCYNWIGVSKAALRVLRFIRPHLIVKAAQADLAFKLQDNIDMHKHTLGSGYWVSPERDTIMAQRQSISDEIAHLKRI